MQLMRLDKVFIYLQVIREVQKVLDQLNVYSDSVIKQTTTEVSKYPNIKRMFDVSLPVFDFYTVYICLNT